MTQIPTMPIVQFSGPSLEMFARAEAAIARIPPTFPLTATVAVNPYLGQTGEPRERAAERLARVGGGRMVCPRADLARMWQEGRLQPEDLQEATGEVDGLSAADLQEALGAPAPQIRAPIPDIVSLAGTADGIGWCDFMEERIGAWAAAHFDQGQAFWPAPDGGLYASWRAFASRDLTPQIAGLADFARDVARLPDDARMAFAMACEALDLRDDAAEMYFHRLLITLGGWAQYARHIDWTADRDGSKDTACSELLTIRLIWDLLFHRRGGAPIAAQWQQAQEAFAAPLVPDRDIRIDAALQEAADRASERALIATFAEAEATGDASDGAVPAIQAAFCIDVRSEILRRALETADEGIRTIGFAGFFGLGVAHRAIGSDITEARLPVLLRPGATSSSALDARADSALRIERRAKRAWGRFKMAAVSAFAFVEAAGPLYLGKLLRDSIPHLRATRADPAPRLDLSDAQKVATARAVLGAMSLTRDFARLVLIAGHGATVTNAPHASALQCGACGGHAGDVNARLLAGLLNDAQVRTGLRAEGIDIPDATHFIAGLHDTVTDEVVLYDDAPSASHARDAARLQSAFKRAAIAARTERAMVLPRAGAPRDMVLRGQDWAELRPEWGLAGCRAFVAAPRHRSAGTSLGGRAFLHDYDWREDQGFGVLELILTAPVVVASWISLQYHGSSVAPEQFGAGNKLLHNVTGGIGVVEGNGGLLRAGLPWQSVHDGDTLRHEPVRLSVVIEAPQEAITAVLDRHDGLRDLFENGWLALFAMDDEGRISARFEAGSWRAVGMAHSFRTLSAA